MTFNSRAVHCAMGVLVGPSQIEIELEIEWSRGSWTIEHQKCLQLNFKSDFGGCLSRRINS
ncbi:uncharacterized protein Dere_GG26848, isoform A [Drosophila erecta]|nr:uncharacterized protein Dere_GG26848, isoform A [Drosophila erecta]